MIKTDLNNSLGLEANKPIFLHNTLAHNNKPPHEVWSQKVQWFRRYHLDKTFTEVITFAVTLSLN